MKGISLEKAPPKGYLLAYFPGSLIFESYEIRDGECVFCGWEKFKDRTPGECHLFDADTEYRMIWRESVGESIELVLSRDQEEQMDPDLLYTQKVLVQERFSKEKGLPDRLVIVNRYEFSENDTLVLKNYRISSNITGSSA